MKLQYNLSTKRAYEGGNQATLLKEREDQGYLSNAWVTFVQAREMGKRLVGAKGKGVHLRTFISDQENGEEVKKPVHFVVFNADLLEDK